MGSHANHGSALPVVTYFGVTNAVDLLEQLLSDPVLPGRCRSVAEAHFDLDRGVDRLLAIHGDLIC